MEKKQIHSDQMQHSELKETKVLCGDVPDREMLIQALFPEADASDPRSVNYQRTLVRPVIQWGSLFLNIIVMFILSAGIFYMLTYWGTARWVAVLSTAIFAFGYFIARLRRITLCTVRLYQYFAPVRIRNKCRFEPSCSEYMILAVSKYGAFKGIRKGVQRLKRCNPHGGGYDWP
ncbi:membrane protein insertion efficiency factor YidD [Paenibacillus sp. GCM10027626]|uniref:membrane protein insertion efficiency factor YidD n=1 Tax=Paenibacillus sp. GCM10027626 TaxID=3273411 RepID=UPI00363CD701